MQQLYWPWFKNCNVRRGLCKLSSICQTIYLPSLIHNYTIFSNANKLRQTKATTRFWTLLKCANELLPKQSPDCKMMRIFFRFFIWNLQVHPRTAKMYFGSLVFCHIFCKWFFQRIPNRNKNRLCSKTCGLEKISNLEEKFNKLLGSNLRMIYEVYVKQENTGLIGMNPTPKWIY